MNDEIENKDIDEEQIVEINPSDILGGLGTVDRYDEFKKVLDIQAKILEQQDNNISFLFNKFKKLNRIVTIETLILALLVYLVFRLV